MYYITAFFTPQSIMLVFTTCRHYHSLLQVCTTDRITQIVSRSYPRPGSVFHWKPGVGTLPRCLTYLHFVLVSLAGLARLMSQLH